MGLRLVMSIVVSGDSVCFEMMRSKKSVGSREDRQELISSTVRTANADICNRRCSATKLITGNGGQPTMQCQWILL